MADIGKTNTYDPDVSWHFHESYYKVTTSSGYWIEEESYGKISVNGSWREDGKYITRDIYLFGPDDFGSDTYELICDFAAQMNYYQYNMGDCIAVYPWDPESIGVLNEDTVCHTSKGREYTSNSMRKTVDWYISSNGGLPGQNVEWVAENVEPTPEPTTEPTEPTPEPTATPTVTPGDGENTDNPLDPIDIDTVDDASEILREIYKQDTAYYTDMLEVSHNDFDIQVVHLSVSFVSVFLCGVLVGCAFARSLWHKMNAG